MRKISYLFAIIIIALALHGCSDNKKDENPNPSDWGISVETQRDSSYYEEGASSLNVSICMKIVDPYIRDSCITSVSIGMNDSSICEMSSDENSTISCNDKFIADRAFMEQNGIACMKIKDNYTRGDCLLGVAMSTSNASLCSMEEGQLWRDDCLVGVGESTLNISVCAMAFDESMRSDCYSSIAALNLDKTICDNVKDLLKKQECLYNVEVAINVSTIESGSEGYDETI